ncbi:hypothetical protein [Treponema sp.]|uniref:hypothetical protein n=1 Tax=Treponema sp. TaxID=166 RepID=UPI003EFBEAC9
MFNVKNVASFSGFGFVLSFLISIVFTGRFFVASFRALIFALLFGVLALVADFLNRRFLVVETLSDTSDETGKKNAPKAGSVVNITIDDENLTEDDGAPIFDVASNRGYFYGGEKKELNSASSDSVQEDSSAGETMKAAAENAPAEFSENTENASVAEQPDAGEKTSEISAEKAVNAQEIDSLPDIGAFSDDSEGDINVISDSEFAQANSNEKLPSPPSDGKTSVNQDTKTIASAIRTLLKRDEM